MISQAMSLLPGKNPLGQAGAAQEAAQGRQSLGVVQQVALGVAGISHGAEFEQSERLAVQAKTLLVEEDGGTKLEAHQ